MSTGDMKSTGEQVAKILGINTVFTELLPHEKVNILLQKKEGTVAFIGDGINDAPALTLADIGIAMGGLGSDAAIEASDIVIMTDELAKLNTVIDLSKKTLILSNKILYLL